MVGDPWGVVARPYSTRVLVGLTCGVVGKLVPSSTSKILPIEYLQRENLLTSRPQCHWTHPLISFFVDFFNKQVNSSSKAWYLLLAQPPSSPLSVWEMACPSQEDRDRQQDQGQGRSKYTICGVNQHKQQPGPPRQQPQPQVCHPTRRNTNSLQRKPLSPLSRRSRPSPRRQNPLPWLKSRRQPSPVRPPHASKCTRGSGRETTGTSSTNPGQQKC